MQKQRVFLLLLIGLILSSFSFEIQIPQAYASPDSELLFEEDFDSLIVGETPHSIEWQTQTGRRFYNRSDCYFTVTDTICNSSANSLMLNDTQASSSVYGCIMFGVDLFSYQNGKVTIFFQVTTTTEYPKVKIQRHHGKIATQYYFEDDGSIYYYDGSSWILVAAYLTDTWYNVTTVFGSSGVDYYVNGIKEITGADNWQHEYDIDFIEIDVTRAKAGITNTVYIDEIRVEGEKTTEDFFLKDDSISTAYAWVCTDTYRATLYRLTSSSYKGQIHILDVKTSYGSWINTICETTGLGLFWSESVYPPEGGGTQVGISDIAGGTITITNTSDTVTYYTTVQDSYFNFTNTIWFFKEQPYIGFKVYRKMLFADADTTQKQVDFLFENGEIEKYYYTNASGLYANMNDWADTTVTTIISSLNTYFPFYGYYLQQNYTIATIITYPYDTAGWLTECYTQWKANAQPYSEWEISFGQCASEGGTPTYENQIEEVAGVLAIYQGDEGNTNSVQSLSETLYSDWSDLKDKIALEPTSDLYTATTRLIKSTTYHDETLTIEVNASSTDSSVTKIYCGSKGEPVSVIGSTGWTYDSASTIITLPVTHSSSQNLWLDWTPKHEASGYFVLSVYVKAGDQSLSYVPVTVKPLGTTEGHRVNKTTDLFGLAQFELPQGSYLVQAKYEERIKTLRVWMTGKKDIGLDFGTPPLVQRADLAIIIFLFAVIFVYFLVLRGRR